MILPAADVELHNWIRWAEENGSSFLKATAGAALIADLRHYNLLASLARTEEGVAEGSLRDSVSDREAGVLVHCSLLDLRLTMANLYMSDTYL